MPGTLTRRLFRVSVDGLAFITQSQQMADALGRVQVLNEALDAVCAVVAGTLPQGHDGLGVVYRDETGCVFLVPDADGFLDQLDAAGVPLSQRVRAAFAAGTDGEAQLGALELSDPFPGDAWPGEFLCRPIPPLSADPQTVVSWWASVERAHICIVCGLRPRGHGAEGASREARKQRVCCTCLARRQRHARGAFGKGEQMVLVVGRMHLAHALTSFESLVPLVSSFWSAVQREDLSPAIPILVGPRTCLALAPADRGLALARAIHARYQETSDLPPLSLGLAFAHRQVPLSALLDAGRRLMAARPGTFDFITLDDAARRFDVCYDERGQRRDRPIRPYPLADLAALAELWRWIGPENLSPARRLDLLALVEARREAWDQPTGGSEEAYHRSFRQWVRDALSQVDWRCQSPGAEPMARLYQAVLLGVLTDLEQIPKPDR